MRRGTLNDSPSSKYLLGDTGLENLNSISADEMNVLGLCLLSKRCDLNQSKLKGSREGACPEVLNVISRSTPLPCIIVRANLVRIKTPCQIGHAGIHVRPSRLAALFSRSGIFLDQASLAEVSFVLISAAWCSYSCVDGFAHSHSVFSGL